MAIATTPPRPWPSSGAAAVRPRRPSRLLEYFVGLEIICQLALLSSTLGHFRAFFHMVREPGSVRDLAERMSELVRDPAVRAALGAKAVQSARRRFARARLADELMPIYRLLGAEAA
jgi:glycosyltransferase involved in cell wall biosynthesis